MNALRIGNITVNLPIIQGGMGVGISLSSLASAVANEGGVGVISTAAIGINENDFVSNFLGANMMLFFREPAFRLTFLNSLQGRKGPNSSL